MMPVKIAATIAFNIIEDAIYEFLDTQCGDKDDPWILEARAAQETLKSLMK